MGKGCVNGELDTTSYASPIPLIGLYITAATLVCFFSMTVDLVYGFIHKKPFVPCKLFPMNAFTMTVLTVATKIPVDLTTSMPRASDQLCKLTGTALLCTSLWFYMPSLGTMGTSERYGNLAALSVMVITMVVNVCIQMGTGVIFAYTIEHIIIIVCILVLLLLMWSSAIAFRGQKEFLRPYYRSKISEDTKNAKDVQGLRELLVKLHLLNYTGSPQTLLCETSHHHAFGLLCALSSAVVLQAMLRLFALKNMRLYCSAVSDYRWSILIVIVAQFLTIAVGTFSIIYRWISFVSHTNWNDLCAYRYSYRPERELEYLKLKTLSFRFLRENLSNVFLVVKDFIMDVLICTQIVLYTCSSVFIGLPIYTIKKFLECIIPFDRIFHEHSHGINEMSSVSEIQYFELSSLGRHSDTWIRAFTLSSLRYRSHFNTWISKMAMKDMMRWTNTYKRDSPTHLIQLISKCPASKSECALFIRKLEATGKEFLESFKEDVEYEYRVSCVSVLVLSGMLAELMPSSRRESLMQSLNDSFEILYYVDQKTDTPSVDDEIRWTSTKDVWAQWENPNHWLRIKIIKDCSLKKFKESELEQHHFGDDASSAINIRYADSLAEKHLALIVTEFSIICKFIQKQEYETDTDLFDFLEMCFVEMLCFILSSLPLAILKEINGDYPTEIGEGRVKSALKFLCKLELLEDIIEWSWPTKFDCGLEVEAEVSNVGNSDASAAANDGDATIREIGSNEIV